LDTIQSFGRLKLDDADETGWMRNQRTDYYTRLVEAAEPELLGPRQLVCLKRLQEEHYNLQAVLQWKLDTQDADGLLRLVGPLWRYWWMRSQHNEGREWLEKALALPGPQSPLLRAKALNGAGILARGQGDFNKASIFLHESLKIYTCIKDKDGIATVQNILGLLAHTRGETAEATRHYQESLKYRREIGDKRGLATVLHNLSMISQEQSELSQAEALLNESLALFQDINDTRNIAATQVRLGYIMYEFEKVEQSEDYLRKGLSTMKDLGQRNDIIECLEGFAGVAALLKHPSRGARLLAAAQAQREVIGIPIAHYQQDLYQRIVESVKNQLDPQALELYRAEGRGMSLEDAVEYALNKIQFST
jgi:tetratricopeptide (TPR) repeat protein